MAVKSFPCRILIIDASQGYGGPSRFLLYMLSFLDREKFFPQVAFYYYNNSHDTGKIKELGVPVVFLNRKEEGKEYVPFKRLLRGSKSRIVQVLKLLAEFVFKLIVTDIPAILKLKRLIKEEGTRLVILNNDVNYHLAGVLGTKLAGIPCICRKAGGIGEGIKIKKKFLTPLIDLFVAISTATEEDQRKNLSTRRLATVFEGINLDMFVSRLPGPGRKVEMGIPSDRKVVANISRFVSGKGQKELLDAAQLVVREYPGVIFLMVGDGETIYDLKQQVERLKLSDNVIFTGWRNDITEFLSISDIFVHCPTTSIEGLGIANLEAMAMGKPSVVSANGGLTDAVIDGITGFVVPPGDIKKTSEAILTLLNNEELAKQLGENGRARAEEKFDIKKNVRELEELFAAWA